MSFFFFFSLRMSKIHPKATATGAAFVLRFPHDQLIQGFEFASMRTQQVCTTDNRGNLWHGATNVNLKQRNQETSRESRARQSAARVPPQSLSIKSKFYKKRGAFFLGFYSMYALPDCKELNNRIWLYRILYVHSCGVSEG